MQLMDAVVVVTGASSGIGRETALELGRKGAKVVVAARNAEALSTLVEEVDRLGGEALAVPTDVSDEQQVVNLAKEAVTAFGHLDAWVNVAAVSTYANVEDTSTAEIRRVIDVNLMGAIHGMKAALPHLKERGGGTILNVSSALAKRAIPLQAAYCASKHGLVAFAEALRMELRAEGTPIHVVDVLPASINTPLFEHARSKLGVLPRPIAPVYEPRVVAETIVRALEHPVRSVFAGGAGRLLDLGQRVSPSLVDWYLLGPGRVVEGQRTDRPDDAEDNLERASTGPGDTTGSFGTESYGTSLYTRLLGLHPARARLVATGALAGMAAATARALRR
jgi:NAD(P)-dependent dehydrogenase (short-subunit alcohol dehydrogenase family)